jgi:hypothetical protein
VTGRRGRGGRKLLIELKERRGYSHLKEEALDRTMWRNRFGEGFGPVVRQNTEWVNESDFIIISFVGAELFHEDGQKDKKRLKIICVYVSTIKNQRHEFGVLRASQCVVIGIMNRGSREQVGPRSFVPME